MAGKESRGVASAFGRSVSRATLYSDAHRRHDSSDTPAVSVFISWLERCGANTITVSPERP